MVYQVFIQSFTHRTGRTIVIRPTLVVHSTVYMSLVLN